LIWNDDLPITSRKDEIIDAIKHNQVVIIAGETGSGKTTQIPKFCLAAGRGVSRFIGCTQPRRIAAIAVANRIAEEMGEIAGKSVGYKIRFNDKTHKTGLIKIMTDGILLAETVKDRLLRQYDTIIVDEAHERNLNVDFILGFLKTLLPKRNDIKIIITSATIDTQKFSKAFDNAPVIEVSGRMFPVDVRYWPAEHEDIISEEQTHVDMAVLAVKKLLKESHSGDILIFMPTEQDIHETIELLGNINHTGIHVLALYARMAAGLQSKVFASYSARKIIVATNIAETSITIPGIKYVIDTGLARISKYYHRRRITSLPVDPISKSSADQRKGRCGRIENGVCIRLYSEEDYNLRPQFTSPEILRANLAEVILRMISLKIDDIINFPFIDRPPLKTFKDGFDVLTDLGAIVADSAVPSKKTGNNAHALESDLKQPLFSTRYSLTDKGKLMAKIPVDPSLSRILIEAMQLGCIRDITVIVAALTVQDPYIRPPEKKDEADKMHEVFDDPDSDFITLLNIWDQYHETLNRVKTSGRMKKFCNHHYISFKRIREWRDVHEQIMYILKEYNAYETGKLRLKAHGENVLSLKTPIYVLRPAKSPHPLYADIHKSILSGFLSNIAVKKEKNMFNAAGNRETMIYPGSALFNRAGSWIVASDMIETSRLFAVRAGNIEPKWLEDIGKDLCSYSYHHPHWERNREDVVAHEQVTLYGLIIVADRPVSYGRIDKEKASEIFIRKAIVDGDVKKPFGFMKYNKNLIEEITDIENRLRKRDILVSEEDMFLFYTDKLDGVYSIKTLQKKIKKNGNDAFLRMTRKDIVRYFPDIEELSLFPDRIGIGANQFDCDYHFDPGKVNDGVTIKIPSGLVSSVPKDTIDWIVPGGLYREKIHALLKGLPKELRKQLLPLSDTVCVIVDEMEKQQSNLITALGAFIYERFGVSIPSDVWSYDLLPDYLKARVAITDARGKEIAFGRDSSVLCRPLENKNDLDDAAVILPIKKQWEKTGLTSWDFPDLPAVINVPEQNSTKLSVYPGLEINEKDNGKSVNLRLFSDSRSALGSHKKAVAVLFSIFFSKDLKFLKKVLTLPKDKKKMADGFKGAKRFEMMVYEGVTNELFVKNIRTKKAFYDHAQSVAPILMDKARDLMSQSMSILCAYHQAKASMHKIQKDHINNKTVASFYKDIIEELEKLVPETFVLIYDPYRIADINRYIKALEIRAQRALINFEKDQVKVKQVTYFSDHLHMLLEKLVPSTSGEKRKAIEEFFWLIEEYKVSVYAQELKTAQPVSKKKLENKLVEIQRMA
jgi:ATP-dependent helicase HrpA